MTEDLNWLAYTALLTAVLWLPYIVGSIMTKGMVTPAQYKDIALRWKDQPAWLVRANRMHLNAVEAFAPFAALVLIAQATGQTSAQTALWAMVFFWARLAHAVVFLLGLPYLRTLAFAVGFVATIALFLEVMA